MVPIGLTIGRGKSAVGSLRICFRELCANALATA